MEKKKKLVITDKPNPINDKFTGNLLLRTNLLDIFLNLLLFNINYNDYFFLNLK